MLRMFGIGLSPAEKAVRTKRRAGMLQAIAAKAVKTRAVNKAVRKERARTAGRLSWSTRRLRAALDRA